MVMVTAQFLSNKIIVHAEVEMKDEWNRTNNPKSYHLVEILMKDGTIHVDMMVKAKYGNLVWRNWDDRFVVGWREQREAR